MLPKSYFINVEIFMSLLHFQAHSKVVFSGQGPPSGESIFHCSWGKLLNTCSNATEVVQWETPSSSRSQPATDNGVRDGRSN